MKGGNSMAKEWDAKWKNLQLKYFAEIQTLEKEREVVLKNRKEVIDFSSVYFTLKYEEYLKFWRSHRSDIQDEKKFWNQKLESDLQTLYEQFLEILSEEVSKNDEKIFCKILFKFGIEFNSITVDTDSNTEIYEKALIAVNCRTHPANVFPAIRYELNLVNRTIKAYEMKL